MKKTIMILIYIVFTAMLSGLESEGLETVLTDDLTGNNVYGRVYDWDQLTSVTQDSLLSAVKNFVNLVNKGRIEESYNAAHARFKSNVNKQQYYNFFPIIESSLTDYDSLNFVKGKQAVFDSPPIIDQFIYGGSNDESDPNHLKVQVIKSIKSQATLIFENPRYPVSYYFVAVLGIENGKYKLYHLGLNPSSVYGRDFRFYSAYAGKWAEEGSYLPAAFARLFAFKLVSYANTTQDNHTIHQMAEYTKLLEMHPERAAMSWIVDGSRLVFVEFDVQELENDVVPEIKYVSNKELSQDVTADEARKLMLLLDRQYPDLKKVFPRILFTAYDKYPGEDVDYKTLKIPLYFNLGKN